MSEQAQNILAKALQLSESERAWIAEHLLESIPDAESSDGDELFAELERRSAEAERDPMLLVPWAEIKRTG